MAIKHIEGPVVQSLGEYLIETALQRQALEQEWRFRRQWQQAAAKSHQMGTRIQHKPASSARSMPGWPCQ